MLKNDLSLIKLFLVFTKIGAILLGGGYVILPIITDEFTNKRKLITHEEIVEYYALSQSLPGIIAANMSVFIGYKLRGKFGALAAIAGITFMPFWTIVLFSSILVMLAGNKLMQCALWGVGIAVTVLIILSLKEIWENTNKNYFFYSIFITSLMALLWLKLSPVQTILIFTFLGICIKRIGRAA